jgi:hypothetical protein
MDLGSILLGVALVLVVAFIVARPLLEQAGVPDDAPGPDEALLVERERVLTALRDLDFDHTMGKLVEDDYAAQRAALVAQGAAVLRQLDALALAHEPHDANLDSEMEQAIARRRSRPAAAGRAPTPEAEPEIEAAVAGRRQTHASRFCTHCGQPLRSDDRFCGACGTAVADGKP